MTHKLLNKFWLRIGMIVAIMTTALTASAAEEVYSTCLFGEAYNSQAIGSYTATWTATNGGFKWSIVNGNNNNNGWAFVKFGRKNNASVGAIITEAAYPVAITKVDLTIDALTAANVNSIKLYTSADNSAWTEAGSFSKATGTQTVDLASPATSLYYKIEFDCASGSANGLVTVSKVEYYYNTGGVVAPSITAADLSISYDSTEGEIEYTVNNPVTGGTLTAATESDWLTVGEVEDLVPFECEVNDGAERTATVTLTYTYGDESVTKNVTITQGANPNGPGSEANPYTVAQARAAIDASEGTQGVYATGIVTAIPTAWNSQYSNITFNFVDAEGDEVFLQAFRCGSTDAADASTVAVGDIVVVKGNLKKYNSTYEFDQGCQLVSLTKPVVSVEAPTFNPEAGTYAEAQSVILSCATEGATIYYTTDGTEPTTSSSVYTVGSVISVSTTTTIKAIAVKGSDESSVASATYFICSATSPYTVAQALDFPEYPANGVYVQGIVSTAPTQAPTASGQLTYYISADGEANNQLQVYKGKGLEQAAFEAQDDIQVGDIVTIFGNVKIYNGTKEFDTGNYLVSFERPVGPVEEPVIVAEDATIAYDVTYYELMFSIENPVEGTELTATTDATWITSVTPSTKSFDRVMIECEANEGTEARTAVITLAYGEVTKEITLTQEAYVVDYAELPFSFTGGKADIEETVGLTQEGLGNDYNATTKLKFDSTGDYVVLKFNERPGKLTYSLRYNGFTEGTFSVQGSVDGETYTDLKTHTPNASSSNVLIDDAVNTIAEDVRYIRWIFTEKGTGNIGLGNIALAKYSEAVDNYLLTIANPENVTITAAFGEEVLTNDNEAEVAEGTEVTVALSIAEGYDFESLTITGEEEGQTVTPNPGTTEGVYTFTMPAFNVTVNATVVEHVEPVTADYVLATSITSGKRYVIASGTEGTVQVMAEQRNNNRGTVAATITDGVLSVEAENEFLIESATTESVSGYSIYDEDVPGYLYAASSGSNYLRTESALDDNGIWTITFNEDGSASVVAQGANTRNVMQFNGGSTIFSCYGSASQAPVYLFEKVEDVVPTAQTVTVTSAGYATMVAETDLEIPADLLIEVCAVKVNGKWASLIAVTDGIPAGAAVLIKADEGEYTFPYATEPVGEIEVNDLVAATEDVVADGTQYILANGISGIAFYKAIAGSTIAAGKAYLVVTSGAKPYYGFEDDATGIEDLNANADLNEFIYNLAGQRLQKTQKGINIVGGKKVAIK